MPVYNGEKYVRAAIESILSQTSGDFELIISDNASTDNTRDICEDLAGEDNRIRYQRNPENLGAARNYNLTFRAARAPYFRWANADDLSGPRLHELCLQALEECSGAVLAYGGTVLVDAEGVNLSSYEDNLDLRHESPARRFVEFLDRLGMTNVIYGLMRSDAVGRGPLMGDGSVPAGDVLFMADLILRGKFLQVQQDLFFRRIHDDASSRDREDEELQQEFWSVGRLVFKRPRWNTHRALLETVARGPVSRKEKARLALFLLRRMYWFRREILRDLRDR
jgi:glycosyltransferase involved in cell wall biosynthesis